MRHLGDLIIYLGALATAMPLLGAVARLFIVRPLKRWLAAEVGAPLAETRTNSAEIRAEVSHNSGSSLKDAVRRVETKVDTLTLRFDDHLRTHER